jgi:hypothetical protein
MDVHLNFIASAILFSLFVLLACLLLFYKFLKNPVFQTTVQLSCLNQDFQHYWIQRIEDNIWLQFVT